MSTGKPWVVIPARAGSKGIESKNLVEVGGRSLIRRAIDTCQLVSQLAEIIVSTDGEEILKAARDAGARVVWRPPEIAGDLAKSEDAVLHAVDTVVEELRCEPAHLLMVQCTSPFLEAQDLTGVLSLLRHFDSAFTAVPSHAFLWRSDPSGNASGINHDWKRRLPRQLLSPEFRETGGCYGMNMEGFRESRNRFFGRIGIQTVSLMSSIEIDDQGDLEFARSVAARYPL